MLRFLGAMIALMAVLATARAESVVLSDSMPSPVLKRPFPMTVYLPDGYERGGLRYPVLYLLHGAGGDENAWLQEGSIKRTADRMIARGEIQPAVIVMPGCRGCWWVDGAVDQAETAFWSDLVPGIERKYRVLTGRSGRLVAGLSAGGYGAVRFAMRYPDRFAAAAALSPAIYADAPPEMSSARVQPPFLKPDGTFDVAAWRAKNYTSFIDTYCRQ
ncbi:MAG: alpha/beta hydrolase [Hyphomicrobiaceae bacterium]